jgi:two-component system response regulator RegA
VPGYNSDVTGPAQPRRILLVEDDVVFREVLARALRSRGFDVVTAGDRSGARQLMTPALDAALVDVRLGADSGLDVLADLLVSSPPMRVVLTTGASTPIDATRARTVGAAAILIKPFDADELVAALFPRP